MASFERFGLSLASDTDSFKAEDRNFLMAVKQKKALTCPPRTLEQTLKLRLPENPASLRHHFDVGLLKRYAKCLIHCSAALFYQLLVLKALALGP